MKTLPVTVADFASLPAVPCPCGQTRRAFLDLTEFPASIHRVEVTADARRHYHRRLTETYYILDCDPAACLELDDTTLTLHPGMCVVIPPGTWHRAVGPMTLLNFVMPKFDPADEWFE